MSGPVPNHLDRAKPFYPLLINYVTQLIGFKELAVRGTIGPQDPDRAVAATLGQSSLLTEVDRERPRKDIAQVLGPLQLRSVFLNTSITVDSDEIAREVAGEHNYLADHLLNAAGSVFVLAHETSKGKPWHDQSPLWEFLRHCRNAAGHGGRFNLPNGEPRRPAEWGHLQITPSLQGTFLFKRPGPSGPGLLSLGDPIRLLWDIEQAFSLARITMPWE